MIEIQGNSITLYYYSRVLLIILLLVVLVSTNTIISYYILNYFNLKFSSSAWLAAIDLTMN